MRWKGSSLELTLFCRNYMTYVLYYLLWIFPPSFMWKKERWGKSTLTRTMLWYSRVHLLESRARLSIAIGVTLVHMENAINIALSISCNCVCLNCHRAGITCMYVQLDDSLPRPPGLTVVLRIHLV